MIVLSATGMREFEWYDENKLPTEVTTVQAAAGGAPPVAAPASATPATATPNSDDSDDDGASQFIDSEFERDDN